MMHISSVRVAPLIVFVILACLIIVLINTQRDNIEIILLFITSIGAISAIMDFMEFDPFRKSATKPDKISVSWI
jgi:hypothetical protein